METIEKLKDALDDLDKKIETLGREAKDEWRGKVRDLKENRDLLKRRFEAAREEGDGAWERAKDGFKKGLADLRGAYQDLRDRM